MAQKPHIVLVPGSGYQPLNYDKLTTFLAARGFPVSPVSLPTSNGARPPTGFYHDDQAAIRGVVEPLVDRGRLVFIIMHGYSGTVGSDSLRGLVRPDRQASGLPGGVVHLFYMSAFIVDEGSCLWDLARRAHTDQLTREESYFHPDGAFAFKDPVVAVCLDLEDHDQEEQTSLLRTFNHTAWFAKSSYCAWKAIPSTYFVADEDLACPLYMQRMMLDDMRRYDVDVKEILLHSAHSPHVKFPVRICEEVCVRSRQYAS